MNELSKQLKWSTLFLECRSGFNARTSQIRRKVAK